MVGDGDISLIFENGDFDTEAVFASSPAVTVKGWFTGQSDEVTMYGQVQIEAQKPTFTCPTDAIEDVTSKMSVEIDDVTYVAERIQKLGTGVSVVYLKT